MTYLDAKTVSAIIDGVEENADLEEKDSSEERSKLYAILSKLNKGETLTSEEIEYCQNFL